MTKVDKKEKRKIRTRSKIKGTSQKLRLCVFRSSKYISAQLIDDASQKTLIGVSQKALTQKKGNKTETAKELGLLLAKKALEKNIKNVVFDKGAYAYHGRVKALAQGAREGGLIF